jgi:hypothetical protein
VSNLRDEIVKQLAACEAGPLPNGLPLSPKTYIRHVRWLLEANDRLRKAADTIADAAAISIQSDLALEKVLDTALQKEAADIAVTAGENLEVAVGRYVAIVATGITG